jgi:hypothetical protein
MLHYKVTESTRIQNELSEYVWGVKLMDSVKAFHFSAFVDPDCWTERDRINLEDHQDRIGGS